MSSFSKNPKQYLTEPYARVLIPDTESGTYTAEILEFPGCIAQGDTPDEAYRNLESVAESWIEAALDLGQEIPLPAMSQEGYGGKIALRLPRSLHRRAAQIAEREGTSLNQFLVAAIAEKLGTSDCYAHMFEKIERLLGQMTPIIVRITESRAPQRADTTSATITAVPPEIVQSFMRRAN